MIFKIYYLKNLCSFLFLFLNFSLWKKTRENFYRSVALNILNTIKTFNTTNRTSRFLFEDRCNSSKNPSSEVRNFIPKLFKIPHFVFVHLFILENVKIVIKSRVMLKWCIEIGNKMLEKEQRNKSYQNAKQNNKSDLYRTFMFDYFLWIQ